MWKRATFHALPLGIAFTRAMPASRVFGAAAQGDGQTIHLVEDQIEEATGENDADALSKLWAGDCLPLAVSLYKNGRHAALARNVSALPGGGDSGAIEDDRPYTRTDSWSRL